MINFSTITIAIENLLKVGMQATVERNAQRNIDPEATRKRGTAWIGIYRNRITYMPGYLTGGTSGLYDSEINVDIEVQSASMKSSAEAEKLLEENLSKVLEIIESNRTLSGTIGNLKQIEINYEDNKQVDAWFNAGIITLTLEVSPI